ncbi:prepilin-type N-terminal cleavage/methylation domain-containing protein [Trichloromonas sp.]|uniref:prepilin-type N-terminal cleavage/methylation domain-containing protein n=1 Tax=Trichloromonas sp. TaxID=3069249 RepID=UPI002A46EAF9|nr:prepilin-type N-terminal cleavage/methylation domain-containing protein [Trichloromonas sp.]
MKNKPLASHMKQRGFTLVEILIALAISGLLLTAVYAAFQSQQKSYLAQDQVAEVQQNIRAGIDFMVREMRMAGYDPTGTDRAGIEVATIGHFGFTQDLNADGDIEDPNESVIYGFKDEFDSEPDGIVDNNDVAPLGRDTGGGLQPVTDNIQAIEFLYFDQDGGILDTSIAANLRRIRSVQTSLLARADRPDMQFTNTQTYTAASGAVWGPYNDNFRRRFQIITVQCRNME